MFSSSSSMGREKRPALIYVPTQSSINFALSYPKSDHRIRYKYFNIHRRWVYAAGLVVTKTAANWERIRVGKLELPPIQGKRHRSRSTKLQGRECVCCRFNPAMGWCGLIEWWCMTCSLTCLCSLMMMMMMIIHSETFSYHAHQQQPQSSPSANSIEETKYNSFIPTSEALCRGFLVHILEYLRDRKKRQGSNLWSWPHNLDCGGQVFSLIRSALYRRFSFTFGILWTSLRHFQELRPIQRFIQRSLMLSGVNNFWGSRKTFRG